MTEISDFGAIVLLGSAGLFLAVLGMRVADRVSLPNAAIFLLVTGLLAASIERLRDALSIEVVERIGVIALIVILFDGGLHIGLGRFRRRSAVPILTLGVVGTFGTAGLVALAGHYVLGFSWITSGLIGAAIRPDRSRGDVLGPRRPRDPRPRGNDPGGRGWHQRPGRDRVDDRDDRARNRGRGQLLDRRHGVHDRDGGGPCRRRRRGVAPPPRDAPNPPYEPAAVSDPGARGCGNHLRAGLRRPWIRFPRGVRRRDPAR